MLIDNNINAPLAATDRKITQQTAQLQPTQTNPLPLPPGLQQIGDLLVHLWTLSRKPKISSINYIEIP